MRECVSACVRACVRACVYVVAVCRSGASAMFQRY